MKDEPVSPSDGKSPSPFPTREDIIEYVKTNEGKVTPKDIAKAFNIKGADRAILRKILREMEEKGTLARDNGKRVRSADQLPPVTVVEVIGIDKFGDLEARPTSWTSEEDVPRIYITPVRRRLPNLARGDRALVRLIPEEDQDGPFYAAQIIRVIEGAPRTVMGIVKHTKQGYRVQPTDKREKKEYELRPENMDTAKEGSLVLAEILPSKGRKHLGLNPVKVVENLGDLTEPRSISMIAIHHHDIPFEFPRQVLEAAKKIKPATLDDREDLRDIPFITIDPADARDHDDAVFAEADDNPSNPGGWRVMVAIADVAYYVRQGSPIDKEARKRGNSCYFPDRVVPMLPEELSNDLCSLNPDEDKAVLVADMRLDKNGQLTSHKFRRAMIRSVANVHYKEVQDAYDGNVSDNCEPLMADVIIPLYEAFYTRMKEHKAREPLELDLPERKVTVDEKGNITSIVQRDRFDAHRLIEEFMIAANVAAAEALEKKHMACMYRVHEEPAMDKMEALRDFLSSLDISVAKGQVLTPRIFNGILSRVKDTPFKGLVNDVVLRSQMQAYYSPENRGHFGLALPRYGHFTSPIRRYADVLVHRGLIRAMGLGGEGLSDQEIEDMERIGEEISGTERRAMAAERESTDRYLAAFLSEQVGDVFTGRISGVQRFGLFISVEPSGADAFAPISTLGFEYFDHDEVHHTLTGQRSGLRYQLGDTVEIKLVEADKVSGSLIVEVLSGGQTVKPSKRGRSANRRPKPGTGQKKGSKGGYKKGGKAKARQRK